MTIRAERFLQIGILYLLAGIGLGIWMGKNEDFTLKDVHAHVNLIGGVLMLVSGLAYKAWPHLLGRLSTVHFLLQAIAVAVLGVSLAMLLMGRKEVIPVLAASEWAVTLGLAIFAINLFRAGKTPAQAA